MTKAATEWGKDLICDVPVRKVPTKLHAICICCGHQAQVVCFIDKPPRLVCSKCGNRDIKIAARDRLQSWSRRRRGK